MFHDITAFQWLNLVLNVCIIPTFVQIWTMNNRLTRLEVFREAQRDNFKG